MENSAALASAFRQELKDILDYWKTHTVDTEHGGFYGQLTNRNQVVKDAVKSAVLNARILWSFSAGYRIEKDTAWLQLADRSYAYIRRYFLDPAFGGVYWSVDSTGAPADTKKQIYAIAFTIYGLTEYYLARPGGETLALAQQLYNTIETYSYDAQYGGYWEAFARDWQPIADLRLSGKDANEKKTMNTHLHVLEAYTNLYRIWKDKSLAEKIRRLIANFTRHIVDSRTRHLHLFFGESWERKSNIVSYGHDIEASWLLMEAAEVLEDKTLIGEIQKLAVDIARASEEGLNTDGSMNYEMDGTHLIGQRHWWVQAEAMVGFLNAWQLTGDTGFYKKFLGVWEYVRTSIIDKEEGEWFWGRTADGSVMEGEDKVGFWKCPYHNSRSCIEVMHRLTSVKMI